MNMPNLEEYWKNREDITIEGFNAFGQPFTTTGKISTFNTGLMAVSDSELKEVCLEFGQRKSFAPGNSIVSAQFIIKHSSDVSPLSLQDYLYVATIKDKNGNIIFENDKNYLKDIITKTKTRSHFRPISEIKELFKHTQSDNYSMPFREKLALIANAKANSISGSLKRSMALIKENSQTIQILNEYIGKPIFINDEFAGVYVSPDLNDLGGIYVSTLRDISGHDGCQISMEEPAEIYTITSSGDICETKTIPPYCNPPLKNGNKR